MNKDNKSVSTSNLINLAGVFAIFALIGFCCWFGKSSGNLTTSVVNDSSKSAETEQTLKVSDAEKQSAQKRISLNL